MWIYDENGNKYWVPSQQFGQRSSKNVLLMVIFLGLLFVFAALSGVNFDWGTSSFTDAPVVVSTAAHNLINAPTTSIIPTGDTEILIYEYDMSATAEAELTRMSAQAVIEEVSPTQPPPTPTEIMFLTDGGLPFSMPYTAEQAELCRRYVEDGIPLISPQRENCQAIVDNDER